MKAFKSIGTVFVATFLSSQFVFAKEVKVEATRCVSSKPTTIHNSIVNYDNYSKLPGANYVWNFSLVGEQLPLIKMIKSQSRFEIKENSKTQGFVWVVMQPMNLTDSNLYPRLLLRCVSSWIDSSQFNHSCEMVKDKPHFGLANFTSKLYVSNNSSTCEAGSSLLKYEVTFTGHPEEIKMIKDGVIKTAAKVFGPAAEILSSLFNEDSFFKNYYENFYEKWIQTLK